MKVYMAYKDNELYAYSINKKTFSKFKSERKNFTYKTIHIPDKEYDHFSFKYCTCELNDTVLYDGETDFMMVCTTKENILMDEFIDAISEDIREIIAYFQYTKLKKKYSIVIDDLTNIVDLIPRDDYQQDAVSNVNIFRVFYYLFKDTIKLGGK